MKEAAWADPATIAREMPTLVFDVNETLLDLAALDPHFERIFGDPSAAAAWFAQLLQHSMVATLTGRYRDFSELGRDALVLTARRRAVTLSDEDVERVLGAMTNLPPHSDVRPALDRLRDSGFRLTALSNSPARGLQAQLAGAGLVDVFEHILSVDEVQRFKPHPDVYRMASDKLGEPLRELCMVAAHNWDTTGAIRAGMKAAFVARPGRLLGEFDERPDIIGADLGKVAERLIAAQEAG